MQIAIINTILSAAYIALSFGLILFIAWPITRLACASRRVGMRTFFYVVAGSSLWWGRPDGGGCLCWIGIGCRSRAWVI
ncbi:hypothetical protein ACI48D_20015 [Massilia sp. LXY-6]|uniref:hypothetical protein n=1 Tax=Massilia sp. LXY-6 TaxID=3379823 RepID=UPI003EE27B53